MELTDWVQAADVADAFLADAEPGSLVLRDPFEVFQDEQVFVFLRTPLAIDDQILVVEKKTGTARLVVDSLFGPQPYPHLEPIQASDD